MTNVTVSASKIYDVAIGSGLLSGVGERIASVCGGEKVMLVTDDAVNALYGDTAENSLRSAGYAVRRFVFPSGEQSKNIKTFASLLSALAEFGMTRSDAVAALGGGVTGDMAGFAAAAYLRGVQLAQIPTTLLAMVDSSVGGKTAVDLPEGKNLAGAFYQPSLVLCDTDVLETLPEEVFRDGCAEMIKHGVILSAELFSMLKEPVMPRIEDIVSRNVIIKRDIVAMDERDTGIRQILNFGHTAGHGIEKLSGYRISHGKAVAAGMVIAARAAFHMGICGEDCLSEIIGAAERYNLPAETEFTPEQLTDAALFDKKRSGGYITLILPEKIGKCSAKKIRIDELRDFMRLGMNA